MSRFFQRPAACVIARKDLAEMLNSPMAYVLFVIFALVTGYFFSQPLFSWPAFIRKAFFCYCRFHLFILRGKKGGF